MQIPDLTALSLASFAALLLLVAAVDTVLGILAALVSKTFSTAKIADFIVNHVLLRVLPIFGLALFGHGIAPLGIPAIDAAGVAAAAALGAYLIETVGSLMAQLQLVQTATKSAATASAPVAPPAAPTS
jgi:hypothetical protein